MAYIPPTAHVTLLATLRRERLLPASGDVLVHPGQRVEAVDIVAQAIVPDEHRLVDVARALGVPPAKSAAFMIKQDGEAVKKGEPIAVRKTALGLARREVRSPVDGSLVVAGDGKALLASLSKPFELRAGLPGNVVGVVEGRGPVIETTGALLEGVWGNGKDQFAVMRVIGSGPHDALLAEQVEMGLRGTILAIGVVQDTAAFRHLTDLAIRGLIVGSLKADLIPVVQKWNIPVVVIEGFGKRGFSLPAYNLLVTNNGRETWLNARAWDRFAGGRPEVIIPLPSPGQTPPPPVDGEALAAGKRVRMVRGALAGQTGTVTALNERALPLPSGARARLAIVELDDGDQPVSIPFANLEILE
jgi:hypothetical protein